MKKSFYWTIGTIIIVPVVLTAWSLTDLHSFKTVFCGYVPAYWNEYIVNYWTNFVQSNISPLQFVTICLLLMIIICSVFIIFDFRLIKGRNKLVDANCKLSDMNMVLNDNMEKDTILYNNRIINIIKERDMAEKEITKLKTDLSEVNQANSNFLEANKKQNLELAELDIDLKKLRLELQQKSDIIVELEKSVAQQKGMNDGKQNVINQLEEEIETYKQTDNTNGLIIDAFRKLLIKSTKDSKVSKRDIFSQMRTILNTTNINLKN
jgi:hypothetical protein